MDLQKKMRDRWEGEKLQGMASGKGLYLERRTFLLVAMIKSIRIFLSVAAHMDYEI